MLLSLLAQVATLLIISVPARCGYIPARATTCNGFSELCSRSYGNASFVGAHNSYAVGATDLASNQDYDVTQQLNDGIRFLQLQVHQQSDGLHLCHTTCFLKDGGLLVTYLKKVKTWVDAHPNDVLTILIVNSDNQPPTQFQNVYQSSGLESVSYSPTKSPLTVSQWPTLGEMIDSKKTVVTFLASQADFATVPYLIDEFAHVWETAFDVTNSTFPCTVDRTQGNAATQLYLINHYLDTTFTQFSVPVPDKARLNVTNAASGPGSLGAEVETCKAANGRPPNFLLVDFYEYGGGSVFQVAANENGVQYNPSSPIATPILNGTSPSSTSTPLNSRAFAPAISTRGFVTSGAILSAVLGSTWATF